MAPLTYLSGIVVPAILDQPRDDLGLLLTPHMGNRPDLSKVRWWGADNGCFGGGSNAMLPLNASWFDETEYLDWLDRLSPYVANCAFATIPDMPYDWNETSSRFSLAEDIALRGFSPAVVLQDGMNEDDVPWSLVGGAFIGGSDQFKLVDAEPIVRRAVAEGKWCHMGRVNSRKRMQLAKSWGCSSADGTYLNFGRRINGVPENLARLHRFLDQVNEVPAPAPIAPVAGVDCQTCLVRLDDLTTREEDVVAAYGAGPLKVKREGHQLFFTYQGREHRPVRLCDLERKAA